MSNSFVKQRDEAVKAYLNGDRTKWDNFRKQWAPVMPDKLDPWIEMAIVCKVAVNCISIPKKYRDAARAKLAEIGASENIG